VKPEKKELENPLVILVHDSSLLRMWMKKSLSQWFRVSIFSSSEDALIFARSVRSCDALITDLNLALSALGGCNVARDFRVRFPQAPIFVFSDGSVYDYRLVILQKMRGIHFLYKPFDALFISRRVQNILKNNKAQG
jgi:DNA-binding response OmpR family regulator